MKTFEYKDHFVIIQKERGHTNRRKITIQKLIPERRIVKTMEVELSLKKAELRAKDFIGW